MDQQARIITELQNVINEDSEVADHGHVDLHMRILELENARVLELENVRNLELENASQNTSSSVRPWSMRWR